MSTEGSSSDFSQGNRSSKKTSDFLKNKRILLTRGIGQEHGEMEALLNAGAELIYFPALKFVPIPLPPEISELLLEKKFDIIFFTSANAVRFFFDAIEGVGKKTSFDEVKFVAIGEKTALTIKEYKLPVWFTGKGRSTEEFLSLLPLEEFSGKSVLFPISHIGKSDIPCELSKICSRLDVVPIYSTIAPDIDEIRPALDETNRAPVDCFIFTSPSAFDNYLKLTNLRDTVSCFKEKTVIPMGKTTAKHITSHGISISFIPKSPSLEEVAVELLEFLKKEN